MTRHILISEEEIVPVIYDAVQKAVNNCLRHLNLSVPSADTWFDLNELCSYHPDKPAKATVYGWVHKKIIPNHKSGKKLRFRKSEIDLWLQIGRQKTLNEIINEATDSLKKKEGGKK